MDFEVSYYTDSNGKKPVKDFLDGVFNKNQLFFEQCISAIEKVKHRVYHKEPFSKALGNGLFEIRIRSKNDIARIMYAFIKGRQIILLHAFIKKTNKTPIKELETAIERLGQVLRKYKYEKTN